MGRLEIEKGGFRIGAGGMHINYDLTRQWIARLGFYLGSLALVATVWEFQQYMFSTGQSYVEPWTESLAPLQEQQLQAFLDMNRLLITLGTSTLAAVGLLLGQRRQEAVPSRRMLAAALGCAASAGLSVYFGYVSYQTILWMLQSHFFDLDNPEILWARKAHFYTLLLGAFFFADFVLHDLIKEDRDGRVQNASAA